MIAYELYGDLSLEIQSYVVCHRAGSDFLPAILDDRAGVYGGDRKRPYLQRQPAGPDDGSIEDRVLLQLHDGAIRFDCAAGYVDESAVAAIGELYGALRFLPAFGEDFYADVVVEDQVFAGVVDVNLPEDHLRIGVLFD